MAISTQDFIQQIDSMTVLELNSLVKALEDHYGVSAAAAAMPMAAAGGGAAAAAGRGADEFTVTSPLLTTRSTSSRRFVKSLASA